jgi:hypothetical protein
VHPSALLNPFRRTAILHGTLMGLEKRLQDRLQDNGKTAEGDEALAPRLQALEKMVRRRAS